MRAYFWLSLVSFLLTNLLPAQEPSYSCQHCAEWNVPQPPFKIYGNTYYVGPHALSSILITSDAGHILIDGALPQSAKQIAEHIHALGFRIEDVKLILNSHVHFDHAGGIADLQRLSGGQVVASEWSAAVMTKTGLAHDDPQYGVIPPIPLVANVKTLSDGETFHVGTIAVTAHLTPGHTPGGTSWTWKSCEADRCLNLVYADSLTPVSADRFKFTRSSEYPNVLADFNKSFEFLRSTPCEVLLTPHPEASDLWGRLKLRQKRVKPNPLVNAAACRTLADQAEKALRERIAAEAAP